MFDYKSGPPPQEKDLIDIAVDWFDEDQTRWVILADWIGVLSLLGAVFILRP